MQFHCFEDAEVYEESQKETIFRWKVKYLYHAFHIELEKLVMILI